MADRMMAIAGDPRMSAAGEADAMTLRASRNEVLEEAAEIYELYDIALYGQDGRIVQGTAGAPAVPWTMRLPVPPPGDGQSDH